ncbi:MAG: hypothetical protein J0J03_08410 [Leifsonia sp.]|nr:hypothetical protein [Leifsonia sp.]
MPRSPRRRLESAKPPRQLMIHAALQQGGRLVDSARRSPRRALVAGVGTALVALTVVGFIAVPKGPTNAEVVADYIEANAQSLTVSPLAAAPTIAPRDAYSATPGIDSLKASGTNYDFAKLVMLYAGWPQSENNITVFTRWMRQENGVDDWWNRNNPLNNGWGSGGGGGTGTYDSLDIAAQNAAEALLQNGGYAEIAAAFASSAEPSVTENAIWNSPWASGHYAYGGHWSYTEVPVVKSPDGTW